MEHRGHCKLICNIQGASYKVHCTRDFSGAAWIGVVPG